MRTVYLDCSTGVSGDMLLASLAHVLEEIEGEGAGFAFLKNELTRLNIEGFGLEWSHKKIGGIMTWHVDVIQTNDQPLRTHGDLMRIVDDSGVTGRAAEWSRQAITLLGEAEAKVHGVSLEKVHFHEIGAVDTIVDIVGSMVLLDRIGAETVVCSPVDLGSGFVHCAHGKMPVPAPACALLAQSLITFGSECGMERATPTGLTVLRTVVDNCGTMPMGRVRGVGYGSGGRSSDEHPTYVRAFMLEKVAEDLPNRDHNHA
ncbi:LarC family nickel insertion protein [Pseudodesulfovibrio sp. zrk46]|uniref:LarC family nickel insertion protein n=1 Tax=Pseudodesulfovibrio sp. zrk46 TaxID=2725288 RepID=UPI00144943C7|nr:LarC family nickel insertion protein [Pseudodesulfovibrio sp. zrk46]QJB56020.1 LarC family nickel insertion protein [Pseudodesulfovibrio sp. zrk46]